MTLDGNGKPTAPNTFLPERRRLPQIRVYTKNKNTERLTATTNRRSALRKGRKIAGPTTVASICNKHKLEMM